MIRIRYKNKGEIKPTLLYAKHIKELTLLSASLEMRLGSSGTLSLEMDKSHPCFGDMKKLETIIYIYNDSEIIYKGRVIDTKINLKGIKEIECEGALAFLLDSHIRPYEFHREDIETLVREIVNEHNKVVDVDKRFRVGTVEILKDGNQVYKTSNYDKSMDFLKNKLVDNYGGYLMCTHEDEDINTLHYIYSLRDKPKGSIEYGKNLLDINQLENGENFATTIIPLGASRQKTDNNNGFSTDIGARLTIEEINNGLDFIENSQLVEKYGRIEKVVEHNDITTPRALLEAAREDLKKATAFQFGVTLKAIDLQGEGWRIGQYIRLRSKPHDIEADFLLTKIKMNLLERHKDVIELGEVMEGLTKATHNALKKEVNKIQQDTENVYQRTNVQESKLKRLESQVVVKIESEAEKLGARIEDNTRQTTESLADVNTQLTKIGEAVTYDNLTQKHIFKGDAFLEGGKVGGFFFCKENDQEYLLPQRPSRLSLAGLGVSRQFFLFAGRSGAWTDAADIKNCAFRLTRNGEMYSKRAYLLGGGIGGWVITESKGIEKRGVDGKSIIIDHSGGDVGERAFIGCFTSGQEHLWNGTLCAMYKSGRIKCTTLSQDSDERLKRQIQGIDTSEALETIKETRIVSYKLKRDEKERIGIIAQEFEKLNSKHEKAILELNEGMYSASYIDLNNLNIAAVQALIQRVEKLEKEVEEWKKTCICKQADEA